MKKILPIFLFIFSFAVYAEGGALKLGVLPSNPNSQESLNVFVKFLSEKTGNPMELVIADVDDLLKGLAGGDISFADLTSGAFATAEKLYQDKIRYIATVAARNEKGDLVPYYKGLFFALKESSYKSLLDLKGKSFGFVSRSSTSGYIYPVAAIHGLGIEPETFFGSVTFTGDHAKIFEGIKGGFLDAGVSNYDAYDKARALYGNIFRIIGETEEIPSGAIVASSSVDGKVVKLAEEALLGIKPADPVVNYPGFLYKGFVKKGGGFYNLIKKLISRSVGIPYHPHP
ncbi:MAG: hypothetical protein A3I09_00150 [Deltaproteobacteria bacterium RIFCSPLOWO2_02_FULL_47_10]|nr:MAG: hypothetical protein A3I09_00150 [Deltaproteobacteria bacterium RIFCSPLOWO2_02_FULL_47_10]